MAVMEYHVVFLNSTYLHKAKKSRPIKGQYKVLPVCACNFPWTNRMIHPSISSYALVPFLPVFFFLSFFLAFYFLLPFPSTSRVFYSTTQQFPSRSAIDPQSLFSRLIRFVEKTPLPSSLSHSFYSCFKSRNIKHGTQNLKPQTPNTKHKPFQVSSNYFLQHVGC